MNKKIILAALLPALLLCGSTQLLAQTFTGPAGANIPGTGAGFYCSNAATSLVNVNLNGFIGTNYEIENVTIDVTHEVPAEMQLSLISPAGNIINLSIGNGGSLDGAYQGTVFNDGGNDITNSITPFTSGAGYEPQGNTFAAQFAGESMTGDWTLEICDLADNANGGVINGFSITFNQLALPGPDPVYDIQVASINNINVNLNDDCQFMLLPSMVLTGNFDADGDGNTPPDEAYFLTVMDDNPCNGPIIDGCGDWEIWVSSADTTAQIERGFDGCAMGNILAFNTVPNPGSGQFATVDVAADTITLTTQGGSVSGPAVAAGIGYTFDRSGTAAFRFTLDNVPLGPFDVDVVIISFDGTVTTVPSLSFAPVNGVYTIAQPLDVMAGDLLQIELQNQDGASAPGDSPSVAQLFDFFFIPTVSNVTVTGGSLPLSAFVNATDATPAQITAVPTQSTVLYTGQLGDVLINNLPLSVSRSYVVDGQTGAVVDNSLDPLLLNRLNLAGGLPTIFDGCSDVRIIVNDQITSAGNCVDVVVTRTFAAQDLPECASLEAPPGPTLATQTIVFTRPSLADVMAPPALVEISCQDFDGGSQNPLPNFDDYPSLQTANGPIFLFASVENIGVSFEDSPRIMTCDNTFKFVRTYTVIDWCDVETQATFTQLVKVGDFEGPTITPPSQDLNFDGVPDGFPLFFSTNSADCSAFFDVTSGVTVEDDCSDAADIELTTFIFPGGDLNAPPLGPYDEDNLATNIPIGDHLLQYIATDPCGNADTLNVPLRIADRSAPTAICEDGLNVSLNGQGFAILMATDVNEASSDDCAGTDLLFEIAFVDEDNNPISDWMPSLTLDCSNIGVLKVGLRVTDDGNMDGINEPGIDNSNICCTEIMVGDESSPICIPPTSIILSCADLDGDFPSDLDAAFAADPGNTISLLNARFGAPNGVDNCPGLTFNQQVMDNRNDCGVGTITRSFGVTDAQGFVAISGCVQNIQIAESNDYSILFPNDEDNMGCFQPSFNGVSIIDGSCDMITVGTRVDTFEAQADECRIIRVTYEVINLCEYSTLTDPYVIPRDADMDGIVGEQVVLHVTPGANTASIVDDQAFLDRDLNRNNGNTIANLDTGDGGLVPGQSANGYGLDPARGYFLYQQFITVLDHTPPNLGIDNENTVAMDSNGDCEADLEVDFSITDECSMDDVTYVAEVDLFANDFNNDGTITLAEFVPSYTVPAADIDVLGLGLFRANLEGLPIGRHAIRIVANDGCSNFNPQLLVFTAEDGTATAPICINGLVATLSANEDGDGVAQVSARTFVVDNNGSDCSGPVELAIYRRDVAMAPGFTPDPADTLLTVTCDDLGNLPIRVYAIDAVGMTDFCETVLTVQAFTDDVCNPPNNTFSGIIAGSVKTPQFENQEGVEINITANATGEFLTFTNHNGNYVFENLMEGDDYTVEPEADPAVDLSRVTTGDLILISRHILQLETFSEPYQYVAADVTADQNINILDMIAIRRVILGLALDYNNSDSWKFISAAHDFGDLPDGWLADQLMTVYNINNLEGNMLSADFMAIEMGNVSDATEQDGLLDHGQQREIVQLGVPAQQVRAGEVFDVPFSRTTDWLGFQTTLQLADGLELLDVTYATAAAEELNLAYASRGLIGIAHVHPNRAAVDPLLFTLHLRATRGGEVSDLLTLGDALIRSEAYRNDGGQAVVNDLALSFADPSLANARGLILDQNHPNPFGERTHIDYRLPTAGRVELSVHDQRGRLVLNRQIDGEAGRNRITLLRAELGNVSGLYYYTLRADGDLATRKMILR